MDWTHTPKSTDLYHTSSPDIEPTGKEKARPPKKNLAPKRMSYTWGQLERLAQIRMPGGSCRQPMI